MQSLNKGEWAEFYAFLKLLADGRLYYGDENLNLILEEYFEIDRILKTKEGVDQIFYIKDKNIFSSDFEISKDELKNLAQKIFKKIINGEKTFFISEAEDLKGLMNLERFSEPSGSKADIRLSLVDKITNNSNIYGFSIKTKLKAKSTLINSSSHSTGFKYKIKNFDDFKQKEVNFIEGKSKVNQRIAKILELGGRISFVEPTSEIYKNNLKMVDTSLDTIIGEMLISAYIYNQKVLKNTIKTNRFTDFYKNLNISEESLIYKLKNFLNVSAVGMTPSKPWDGNFEVDGGLVIVKADGDIVGYFVFSLNKFKEYLWRNTYFETPSTSRHDFGYVYKKDGEFYFDLNIQIRFN